MYFYFLTQQPHTQESPLKIELNKANNTCARVFPVKSLVRAGPPSHRDWSPELCYTRPTENCAAQHRTVALSTPVYWCGGTARTYQHRKTDSAAFEVSKKEKGERIRTYICLFLWKHHMKQWEDRAAANKTCSSPTGMGNRLERGGSETCWNFF